MISRQGSFKKPFLSKQEMEKNALTPKHLNTRSQLFR